MWQFFLWQFLNEYWDVIINYSFFMSCDLLIRQMYCMFCHDSTTQSTSAVLQTHCVLSHPQPRLWQPLILLLGSTFSFPWDPSTMFRLLEFSQTGFVHIVICIEVVFIPFQVFGIHFSYGQMMFYCLNIPIYFPVYFW